MCVVALAWKAHPRWQLVLIGNRDEFHERPSAPLGPWDDAPHVLAGRDLRSGGSWLGVSEEGRLAVVTNVRGFGDPQPDRASRGALVSGFLESGALPSGAPDAYNSFNLCLIDQSGARFHTNRPAVRQSTIRPGLHGLSNGTLDEAWPRRDRLMAGLDDWLAGEAAEASPLLNALRDEALCDDTPAIFIKDAVYGTRCSSVVLIDRQGKGQIHEHRFWPDGAAAGYTWLMFQWRKG